MKVAQRPTGRAGDAVPAAVEISIVMPCLNEVETLATCIAKAREAIERGGYSAEIIVADNGSSDGSQLVARELGVRVVDIQRKGYGSALIGGIEAAQGRFVVMGDADASYDFAAIAPLIAKLREGYDLVVGNRFLGGIEPGAGWAIPSSRASAGSSFTPRLATRTAACGRSPRTRTGGCDCTPRAWSSPARW